MIYVASPYSDPDPKVRHRRYLQACYYCALLLHQHKFPYSPVVSNHHFAMEFKLGFDTNTWMAYNFAMLSKADELHVLTLPGWEKSIGVTAETNFFRGARQGYPLYFISDAKKGKRLEGKVSCAPVLKDGLTST